jgi:hypothetical protein
MIPFLDLKPAYAELKPQLDAAYARVMESGWFVLGKEVEAFEQEYAAYCGTAHCVGLGNGLEALELGAAGLGHRAGRRVIVPSNTYIATWLAVSAAAPRSCRSSRLRQVPTSIPTALPRRSRRAPARSCRCISTASRPTWTPSWRCADARLKVVEDVAQAQGARFAAAHRRARPCRRAQLLSDQEHRCLWRRRRGDDRRRRHSLTACGRCATTAAW